MPNKRKEERKDCMEIRAGLDTVFNQMRIAGNRPRTIDSYDYIFSQFIDVCCIEYVEDINIDKLYHYLDMIDVLPATKLIRLKSNKAVLSKFYTMDGLKIVFGATFYEKCKMFAQNIRDFLIKNYNGFENKSYSAGQIVKGNSFKNWLKNNWSEEYKTKKIKAVFLEFG